MRSTSIAAVVFAELILRDPAGGRDAPPTPGRPAEITKAIDHLCRQPILTHHGSVCDTNGSGVVAVFPSCSEALAAAVGMHRRALGVSRSTSGVVSGMRVGISVGEITVDAGDIFGPAVIEAARLQSEASLGETLLAAKVKHIGGDTPNMEFEDLGDWQLKGFAEQISVVRGRTEPPKQSPLDLPRELDGQGRFRLVGRTDALTSIDQAWTETTTGAMRLVVVAGTQGNGKSRLSSEFAQQIHADGATVLFGVCDQEQALPYHPIANALRAALTLDADLQRAVGSGKGPLAPLFPTNRADLLLEHKALHRTAMFEAVAELLQRLAAERPLALVLDDLQWATGDTIQLLHHLLDHPGDNPVMIIATSREPEADTGTYGLADLLASTRHRERVRRIDLRPFDETDIGELLQSRTTALDEDGKRFAAHILASTGGSPLYVDEFLTHLEDTGSLTTASGSWVLTPDLVDAPPPGSLLDIVSLRLGRLDPEIGSLLALGAAVGPVFGVELLATVQGLSLAETLDRLEIAEQTGLIAEVDRPGFYRFVNDLAATALREGVSAARRAVLHEQIAETLETMSGDHIDALAHHWQLALSSRARTRAVHYLRLAADRDVHAFAWETAVDRYGLLLKRLDEDVLDETELRAEIWIELAHAKRALGQADYRTAMTEAASLARKCRRADVLARSAIGCLRPGSWYYSAGDVEAETIDLCEDALVLLGPKDPLRVSVLAAFATTLAFDADVDRRNALLDEAKHLAEELGDPRLIGASHVAVLLTAREPDLYNTRRDIAEELRRIGRATDDPELSFFGALFGALTSLEIGDIDRTMLHLNAARTLLSATRNFWFEFIVGTLEITLDIMACKPNMGPIIDAHREKYVDQPVDWFGVWAIQHAVIAHRSGGLGELLVPLAEAQQINVVLPVWRFAVAMAHLDLGGIEQATSYIDGHGDPDFDDYWLGSVLCYANIGIRLGRRDLCQHELDILTPYRGRVGFIAKGSCVTGLVSTALGISALGVDRLELAEEYLREAIAQADEMGAPFFATESRRHLAATLAAADGDQAEIRELLTQVIEASDEYGFAAERAAALALLPAEDANTAHLR